MPSVPGRRSPAASFSSFNTRRAAHLTLFAGLALALAGPVMAFSDQAASDGQGLSPAAAARQARIERQLAANPAAVPTLADWSQGLPPFDIRLTPEGLPTGAALTALLALETDPAWLAREAAARELEASLPELRVDHHELFGTPQFVRSTRVFLTDKSDEAAPDVVARYIHDHAALFEIDALEIAAARVARDYVTDHNGVRHLTFQQQHLGRDLVGCMVKANVMPDGRLVNISSSMLPRPAGGFAPPEPVLSAAEAVVAAARSVGITLAAAPRPAGAPEGAQQKTTWQTPPELRPSDPVETELVWFPLSRTEIRPAYAVSVPVRGLGHTYDVLIDAVDGTLLKRDNRLVFDTTQPITMRIYTSDGVAPMSPSAEAPDGVQAPLAERELVTIQPADMAPWSPNGWINDNDTETIGNNIAAHLDLNADDNPDLPRPNGGMSRTFDFPLDPTLPPSTYREAAVTQMFYWGNVFHDRLYAMGFNEAAGNFQALNFSGVGTGNDRISVDVHDGNGIAPNQNNANFSSSGLDGTAARVQMYLFVGPNPDRDGGLEGQIAYHEFAHGVSIRLHGGLSSLQSRGMGEGWSDFIAFCLLAEPTDDPDANYAAGPYVTYQLGNAYTTNYYFGIRRFPYSTNMNVNPHTLADIDPGQMSFPPGVPISPLTGVVIPASATSVHNMGEVWCNTLMEARANLWRRDGFSANDLALRLVVDGMKIAPGNPTFLQSRDAILQADMINNGGANRVPLWLAFAKRGMGAGATTPGASTTNGVVESYAPPFNADFTYPDGRPASLVPGQPATFRVRLTPVDVELQPGTAAMVYTVNGGEEQTLPLTFEGASGGVEDYSVTIPPQPCFARVAYRLKVDTSIGASFDPPSGTFAAQAFTSVGPHHFNDMEANTGWSVGPSTASLGIWVRVDPNGTSAQPEDDHTPAPGTMCWVTGQGPVGGSSSAADVDGGYTTLTSPVYDLSGLGDAQISYARWWFTTQSVSDSNDRLRVEASINGGATWTPAETLIRSTGAAWQIASWRLSDIGLAPTSQVRVRFIAEDLNPATTVEAAIDDFRIEEVLCDEPSCLGDFNDSGSVTVQDIFDFLVAYFAQSPAADINGQGGVTVQDIFDFLVAYFAGC